MFYVYAIMLIAMLAFTIFGLVADVGIKSLIGPMLFSTVFTILLFNSAIETGMYGPALILFGMGVAVWLGVAMRTLAKYINKRGERAQGFRLSAG